MIKCICINDRHKPDNIPESHWIKFGQEYTISMIYDLVQPGAIMGVVLDEINLEELDIGYSCFQISRFGFIEQDLPALMKLIENCKGLQQFDANKLMEQEILVGQTLRDFDDYAESADDDKHLGDL